MLQTHIGYTNWQQPASTGDAGGEASAVKRIGIACRLHGLFDSRSDVRESGDVITVEAPHYARAVGGNGLTWRAIPNLGRTLGAVTAFPPGRGTYDGRRWHPSRI